MGLSERSMEARRTRVGASEAAALVPDVGHPYHTPADIYARIVHGIEKYSKPVMMMGNLMEGPIFEIGRKFLREQGFRCRRNSRSVVHDSYVATPDGYCECGGVIECKYVSYWGRELWIDGVPGHYLVQVQLQMAATGRDHAHLWAWQESRWEEYLIHGDPIFQLDILADIERFLQEHVVPRVPPDDIPDELVLTLHRPEGSEFAHGALKSLGDALAVASATKGAAMDDYDTQRDILARAMALANVAELIDPEWTATVGPSRVNKEQMVLTFRRRGSK